MISKRISQQSAASTVDCNRLFCHDLMNRMLAKCFYCTTHLTMQRRYSTKCTDELLGTKRSLLHMRVTHHGRPLHNNTLTHALYTKRQQGSLFRSNVRIV